MAALIASIPPVVTATSVHASGASMKSGPPHEAVEAVLAAGAGTAVAIGAEAGVGTTGGSSSARLQLEQPTPRAKSRPALVARIADRWFISTFIRANRRERRSAASPTNAIS